MLQKSIAVENKTVLKSTKKIPFFSCNPILFAFGHSEFFPCKNNCLKNKTTLPFLILKKNSYFCLFSILNIALLFRNSHAKQMQI